MMRYWKAISFVAVLAALLDPFVRSEHTDLDMLELKTKGNEIRRQQPVEETVQGVSGGCTGTVEQKIINGEKFLKQQSEEDVTTSKINKNMKTVDENISSSNLKQNYFTIQKEPYLLFSEMNFFYIYRFIQSSPDNVSNDFYRILLDCAETSSGKPFLINMCVKRYFRKYHINFSSTCVTCFSDFIGCAFISCNNQCSRSQCNEQCAACTKKKCYSNLLSCTKLDKLPSPCKDFVLL